MKKFLIFALAIILILAFSACKTEEIPTETEPEIPETSEKQEEPKEENKEPSPEVFEGATEILLSEKITVDGKPAEKSDCVTVGGEIIYYHNIENYESGNEYGGGEKDDMHSEEEAATHTLVTITKPGSYYIRGNLKGQLAVDLGETARTDPQAKVTLIFGGAEINCEIAPAVIFYNVYEAQQREEPFDEAALADSGAKIIVADESVNNINGANVAEIYKDGPDGERLHKYDAAIYSKMSMSISGGEKGSGTLNISGEKEGLGTEMHLLIGGGNINIEADDDGINTSADGLSVTVINGGKITVKGGFGREGDGIDSNGKLIINGGELYSSGNGRSADGGIDADGGIFINGGKVVAFGGRNDEISKDSRQLFAVLNFKEEIIAGKTFEFLDSDGKGITAENDRFFKGAVISSPDFAEGKEYTLSLDGNVFEFFENLEGEPKFSGENAEIPERNEDSGKEPENPYEIPKDLGKWLEDEEDIPKEIREWIEKMMEVSKGLEIPEERPFNNFQPEKPAAENDGKVEDFFNLEEKVEGKTVFVLSKEKPVFTGIENSVKAAGKEEVFFTVNKSGKLEDIYEGNLPDITSVECSEKIPAEQIKITLDYVGRDENIGISKNCLLSEGYDELNGLFKNLPKGNYRLTIEVLGNNAKFAGADYFHFDVIG